MEVMDYAAPESWDDKGMDWNAPDPRNADYAMAVKLALMERANVCGYSLSNEVVGISPWKPASHEALVAAASDVARMAKHFVDLDGEYEDDWSDFPRNWTYGNLSEVDGCSLAPTPTPGTLLAGGCELLKRLRNAIGMLHVVECGHVRGRRHSPWGSGRYKPYSEAYAEALEEAEANVGDYGWSWLPDYISAESSASHDWHYDYGDETDDDYTVRLNWESQIVTRVYSPHPSFAFDFVVKVLAKRMRDDAAGYADEVNYVFGTGDSGLEEGMNELRWRYEPGEPDEDDAEEVEFTIGTSVYLPVPGVPVSSFPEDDWPTIRASVAGFDGRLWGFLDFDVEGGFRFGA